MSAQNVNSNTAHVDRTAVDRLNNAAIARAKRTGEPLATARREIALQHEIEGREVQPGEPMPPHGFASLEEFQRAASGRSKSGAAKLARAAQRRRFRNPQRTLVQHVADIGAEIASAAAQPVAAAQPAPVAVSTANASPRRAVIADPSTLESGKRLHRVRLALEAITIRPGRLVAVTPAQGRGLREAVDRCGTALGPAARSAMYSLMHSADGREKFGAHVITEALAAVDVDIAREA